MNTNEYMCQYATILREEYNIWYVAICLVLLLFFKRKGEGHIHYVYIGLKSLWKESQENGKKWFPLDQGTRGSGKEEDFKKPFIF